LTKFELTWRIGCELDAAVKTTLSEEYDDVQYFGVLCTWQWVSESYMGYWTVYGEVLLICFKFNVTCMSVAGRFRVRLNV